MDSECIICIEYVAYESRRYCSSCSKCVCTSCVEAWSKNSNRCPHCRFEECCYLRPPPREYECAECRFRTQDPVLFSDHAFERNCRSVAQLASAHEQNLQQQQDEIADHLNLLSRIKQHRDALAREMLVLQARHKKAKKVYMKIRAAIAQVLQPIDKEGDTFECDKYRFAVRFSSGRVALECVGFRPSQKFCMIGAIKAGNSVLFYTAKFAKGDRKANTKLTIEEGLPKIRINGSIIY